MAPNLHRPRREVIAIKVIKQMKKSLKSSFLTLVLTLLTFCPPGPELRLYVNWTFLTGMTPSKPAGSDPGAGGLEYLWPADVPG